MKLTTRISKDVTRRHRMTRVELPTAAVKKAAPRVLQAIDTVDRDCFERLMGVLELAAWFPAARGQGSWLHELPNSPIGFS